MMVELKVRSLFELPDRRASWCHLLIAPFCVGVGAGVGNVGVNVGVAR